MREDEQIKQKLLDPPPSSHPTGAHTMSFRSDSSLAYLVQYLVFGGGALLWKPWQRDPDGGACALGRSRIVGGHKAQLPHSTSNNLQLRVCKCTGCSRDLSDGICLFIWESHC